MTTEHKTLIGKNEYLFLINDSSNEIEMHCDVSYVERTHIHIYNLEKYKQPNVCIFVIPDKSYVLRQYLPDGYNAIYRPTLDKYKQEIGENIVDLFDAFNRFTIEHNIELYYRTDTHMNLQGGYITYQIFLQTLFTKYGIQIEPKQIQFQCKKCFLPSLQLGIGDLLWKQNLGDQHVSNQEDTFYYSNGIDYMYCKCRITEKNKFRIYNKQLQDVHHLHYGDVLSWDIISNHVIYQHNKDCDNDKCVLIFYDSFLTSTLSLYLDLFRNVYLAKSAFDSDLIDMIAPDYIFEFRVERFLR